MFSRQVAVLALVTAALVSAGLMVLLDAPLPTALVTGVAAGALSGMLRAAVRDGRFPGAHSGRRATYVANLIVVGSALFGPTALGLDRAGQASLSILILATGYAAFFLGSAAVIENDEPVRT
ncbi:MAG: hypothetical protein O3A25_17470 [Acidobacteria bacterium]|nr:hypothetical protein [Acidobacteriota bacterium]